MSKRPNVYGESEEELLEYQRQFLASKEKPAAQVHRIIKPESKLPSNSEVVAKGTAQGVEDHSGCQKDVVDLNVSHAAKTDLPWAGKAKRVQFKDVEVKQSDPGDSDHITSVLADIQEREFRQSSYKSPAVPYQSGFPDVPSIGGDWKQNRQIDPEESKPKRSLFAQKFLRSKPSEFGQHNEKSSASVERLVTPVGQETANVTTKPFCESGQGCARVDTKSKSLITGEGLGLSKDETKAEISKIENDNLQQLKGLSSEEIEQEQRNLMQSLDPKLLAFIKGRSKTQSPGKESGDSNPFHLSSIDALVQDDVLNIPSNTNGSLPAHCDEIQAMQPVTASLDSPRIDPYEKFNIQRDIVHMDVVEHDKLQWMTDVPNVTQKGEGSSVPRFDFDGNIMLEDSARDKPIDSSLYHHGEEPGLPGYTLEELFQMARSNLSQQRVIALHTLAQIISQYHRLKFDGHLNADLLEQLVAAGLPFILRWSLDESNLQIVSAALAGIAAILFISSDQDAVDNLLFSCGGGMAYSLCTYQKKDKSKMTQEELEEDRDLKDVELLDRDMVKGLLQMQILPRIVYIADKLNISPVAFESCMKILTRIAQHGREEAQLLGKQTALLKNVVKKILCTVKEDTSDMQVSALRLLRCLCIASRNVTLDLFDQHGLGEVISVQLMQTSDISTFSKQRASVFQHCLHLWHILLQYAVGTHLVIDLHSVIMMHLRTAVQHLKVVLDETGATLIILLTSVVKATGRACLYSEENGNSTKLNADKDELNMLLQVVESFRPFVIKILDFVKKDLFEESNKISHPLTVASCLQFMSTYFKHSYQRDASDRIQVLSDIQSFWTGFIEPIVASDMYDDLWKDMKSYSDFKESKQKPEGAVPSWPENLPMHGTKLLTGSHLRSLALGSPAILLESLIGLIADMACLNKSLAPKVLPALRSEELIEYIRFICESGCFQKRVERLVTVKVELHMMIKLVEMFISVAESASHEKLASPFCEVYLELVFRLLPALHSSDQYLARRWLQAVVFNPKIFTKRGYALLLAEATVTQTDFAEAINEAQKNLLPIGAMYDQFLFEVGNKEASASDLILDSMLLANQSSTILPTDWMYLPLIRLYNAAINLEMAGGVISSAGHSTVSTLLCNLQFILLLEVVRPALLNFVKEAIRLSRLMCVYLIEGTAFTEKPLHMILSLLVTLYSQRQYQSYFDFSEKLPGITSFYDLYTSLLQCYAASSYGDCAFANLLLVPLQTHHESQFRKALWGENRELLRVFPLRIDEVVLDVNSLLLSNEDEDDQELVDMFYHALVRREARPEWCPLMYMIGVQHVNHYIFKTDHEQIRQDNNVSINKRRLQLLNDVINLKNADLRDDIIYYNYCNPDSEKGFVKYSKLPAIRQLLIQNRHAHQDDT